MSLSMSDPVGAVLSTALDGLAYRQRVSADNVANADTPHFTARTVQFEDSLRQAAQDGNVAAATPTVGYSTAQRGADGNNVDLATETLTAMQSTFSYQLLSRAVGDHFGLITTAIGGV